MPVALCATPPPAIRQQKRSMREDYRRRSGGEYAKTSKGDKAAARRSYLKDVKVKKVPKACWDMFKAFLRVEGEEKGKAEPTLADLIQVIIEGAGGEIDTTNWVTYLVSL